jgi:hypothetical protein
MFGNNNLNCLNHKNNKGEINYVWKESMELLRSNISHFMHKNMLYKINSDIIKI